MSSESPEASAGDTTGNHPQARRKRPLGPVDTGRTLPLPSPLGVVLRLSVFVLFLGLTLGLLERVAAPGGGDLIASKRQVFSRRATEIDTILLGSSHVYRGVIPERFDKLLGEGGVASRSFNYGIQLPDLIELRFVLREALAQGGSAASARPRRVLLEYMRLRPQVDPQNSFIARAVYWHDRTQALLAAQRVEYWSEQSQDGFPYVERTTVVKGEAVLRHEHSTTGMLDRALPNRLRAGRDHILHWFMKSAMVGRNEDLARGVLGRDQPLVPWVSQASGYVSLESESKRLDQFGVRNNPYAQRRELFLKNPDAFLDRVQKLRTEDVVFGDEEWMDSALLQVDDLEVLRLMRDDCRAEGAELVLVVMPANSTDRAFEAGLQSALEIPVLIYTDPDAHPTLYDPALRFDSGHFNEEGARVFTDVLAQDLLRLIDGGLLQ